MSDESKLEERFFPTSEAVWRRWLPWLTMVRGFRMAIEFRSMFVALVAVCVWYFGDLALTSLVPQRTNRANVAVELTPDSTQDMTYFLLSPRVFPYVGPPWESGSLPHAPATRSRVEFLRALVEPLHTLRNTFKNTAVVLWPMQRVTAQLLQVFKEDLTAGQRLGAALCFCWSFLVLAWFGGMISRMASFEFAKREELSILKAQSFTTRRLPSILGAPLITVVGMAFFAIPNLLAGLVMEIPGGDLLVAVFWILVIAAGFFLSLILIAVLTCWPLMTAAICTDGGDAFDGLSRSFSYLFNRPWYGLFLVVLSLLYGSILIYFVTGMMTLAVDLTATSIQWGLGDVQRERVFDSAPEHPAVWPWKSDGIRSKDAILDPARTVIGVWMRVVLAIPAAFSFSYFWCAVTIIYFLLRRREDATPLDEIGDTPSRPSPTDGLPLVGTAAVQHREATAQNDAEAPESNDNPGS